MRRALVGSLGAVPLSLALLASAQEAPPSPTLSLVETISLPDVNGRFDHFALDLQGGRLFVAALGNDTLEVIDLRTARRVQSVSDLPRPTGVVVLEDGRLVGVATSGLGAFRVYDTTGFEVETSVSSLDDADNVRREPGRGRIFVGYGSGALAVLSPDGDRLLLRIPLPGHPESFQLESGGDRVFVNTPEAGGVQVVDREKGSVVSTWSLKDAGSNFPMALDEATGRLFVGCRRPPVVVVLDTSSGSEASRLPVCGDTDDLFYDQARRRLYVSCGEGFVDVIDQLDADHYRLHERVSTRAGARTSLYSSESDRLYVAVPRRNDQSAEIRVYRPEPKPGN